ncbi:hypothetical protein C882_0725 [Caenispirillum salinarum AK4]|uniref:Uncharacterized protein n=1 Tax=Caenispirillum salinarum AK4 TaxID=1238182 RepID=K9HK21_9PROT|nr:hypothetical protein C882_0725 [Caenispirillum salinarum AK4]
MNDGHGWSRRRSPDRQLGDRCVGTGAARQEARTPQGRDAREQAAARHAGHGYSSLLRFRAHLFHRLLQKWLSRMKMRCNCSVSERRCLLSRGSCHGTGWQALTLVNPVGTGRESPIARLTSVA